MALEKYGQLSILFLDFIKLDMKLSVSKADLKVVKELGKSNSNCSKYKKTKDYSPLLNNL
jgi:hypothetical protein